MSFYNKFLESVLLPLGDLATGGSFMAQLNRLRQQQHLPAEKLMHMQRENLRATLQFCQAKIPYYRELGIEPHEDPYQWLRRFPILRKNTLRERGEAMLSRPMPELISCASSGSSGEQSVVYVSKDELSLSRAQQVLWWEWAGYRMGAKILQTGITPQRGLVKGLKDRFLRTLYVPAYGHDEQVIRRMLEGLAGKRGYFFCGYASSLFVFAEVARHYGIELVFEGAISWGDKLFPHFRSRIEETFHTRVHDTYGCGEGLMIGAQRELPYLYLNSTNIYLEVVDKQGQPVADGTLGYVLVTRLDARAMPLLRYYLGDLAVMLPRERYPSERELGFPLLEKVIGRDTDIVRTPSGRFMVVHFFSGIFEHLPEIRQFRVIQRQPEAMLIEYIPGTGFHPGILDRIRDQIQAYLKEPTFGIEFAAVDLIPATPSGKPQIIESLLAPAAAFPAGDRGGDPEAPIADKSKPGQGSRS